MDRRRSSRVLWALVALVLLVGVVVDLTSPRSVLRDAWRSLNPRRTPMEDMIRDIRQNPDAIRRQNLAPPPSPSESGRWG